MDGRDEAHRDPSLSPNLVFAGMDRRGDTLQPLREPLCKATFSIAPKIWQLPRLEPSLHPDPHGQHAPAAAPTATGSTRVGRRQPGADGRKLNCYFHGADKATAPGVHREGKQLPVLVCQGLISHCTGPAGAAS